MIRCWTSGTQPSPRVPRKKSRSAPIERFTKNVSGFVVFGTPAPGSTSPPEPMVKPRRGSGRPVGRSFSTRRSAGAKLRNTVPTASTPRIAAVSPSSLIMT
jgi:hypothetical protein